MDKYYKRKRDDTTPDGSSGPEHEQLALVVVEQPTQNEEQQGAKPVIFEGIELLERDPALRPQIWQYPEHVRDEVRRAYMQLGPMQPKLKKYKPSGPQGHQRRFQFSWFHLFPSWLEYSESSGRAYCFFCFLCSKNIKKRSGFDVQNLRGQGYDGASNMKGEFNGLQALFLKDCPYAYYVHCYAHRLQLALVAASKDVVPVSQFFQKLLFIINTVDSSSKRHDELHDAQILELAHLLDIDQIDTGKGANQIRALKRPGDTRWGSHLASVSSLMDMFKVVSSVLQTIGSDATAGSNRADGDTAFNYLTSYEFAFVLCMMREILGISEALGKALQKKSQDIVNAIRLVSSTKALLEQMRSDDGWEYFYLQVVEFCADHGIDVPDMNETYILRGGRARRQPDHFTKERYFRVEIFRATLDSQLTELNLKFNEKVMGLLSISGTLIPKHGFASFNAKDICKMVAKYYPADFTQQDMIGLEHQLNHFAHDASNSEDLKKISTLTALCRCLVVTGRHMIYNFLDRLLRLLITLPVSTASAERAFSSLKIIKTRLRNKMEDNYLANSLLVQVEREIAAQYSYEDIMADFKARKNRRATL